jgi:hypothetical protein
VLCTLQAFGAPSNATVAPALSLSELVAASDLVVIATPVASTSEWYDGRIVTRTTMLVDRVVHTTGHQTPMQITLITYGGVIGDLGLWVPGEAVFSAGKTYVVFAHDTGNGHVAVGMAQGALEVVRAGSDSTQWVLPPLTGALVTITGGQIQSAPPFLTAPMPLDRLEHIVAQMGTRGPC